MAAILKMPTYYAQVQFDTGYEKSIPNYARKSIFGGDDVIDDVTEGDLKVAPLYSLINEKLTFSVITEKRTTISSLNLVSIGIISL